MATVNLGKIKLKWRGTWSSGGNYAIDDVVEYADGSVTSSFIAVAASSNQAPSSSGTVNTSYWNLLAKGQATSPTTTQGDIIVRGSSADERLAIGTAGKVLKVNSSANGLEYGDGGKVLQIVRARTTNIHTTSNNHDNMRQNLGTGNGTSIVSVNITPQSAGSSHFYIWCQCRLGITGNAMAAATLMHGGTKVAAGCANGYAGDAGEASLFAYVDTTGLSGSQTFDFRNHGTRGGNNVYANGNNSGQDANLAGTGPGGANNTGAHITVMEMLD